MQMSTSNTATPKFPVMAKSLHAELKSRVNQYLAEHAIKATGNYKLFSKAIILLTLFVLIYIHLVFFTPPVFYAIIECIKFLLGERHERVYCKSSGRPKRIFSYSNKQ